MIKKLSVGDTVKLKNGRIGIIEDYDDKYYYVKDNNTNLTKIRKMRDGTWELPFTIKQAQDLYDLLYTDKFADKEPMEVLYGLFGDDDLFDALYRGFSKGTVVRFVKRLINDYKERPNNYFVKPEKGVLEILEKIVKDYE